MDGFKDRWIDGSTDNWRKFISFCGFDLFCLLLDKDFFIENLYIVLEQTRLKK